jgi:hypothetical protein
MVASTANEDKSPKRGVFEKRILAEEVRQPITNAFDTLGILSKYGPRDNNIGPKPHASPLETTALNPLWLWSLSTDRLQVEPKELFDDVRDIAPDDPVTVEASTFAEMYNAS